MLIFFVSFIVIVAWTLLQVTFIFKAPEALIPPNSSLRVIMQQQKPASQGHNMAVTVIYLLYALDCGPSQGAVRRRLVAAWYVLIQNASGLSADVSEISCEIYIYMFSCQASVRFPVSVSEISCEISLTLAGR